MLAGRADFDRLARIFDPASAMPHVLFVIDRHSKSAPLHFINTPRYAFHEDFLRAKGLLQGGKPALNRNYREPGRRFILGTLVAARAQGLQLRVLGGRPGSRPSCCRPRPPR